MGHYWDDLDSTEWKRNSMSIPVSSEMLDEIRSAKPFHDYIQAETRRVLDKMMHPWRYPDPPAISWTFEPFPRVARVLRWLEDHRPARFRPWLAGKVGDLAYRIYPTHEQWGDEW